LNGKPIVSFNGTSNTMTAAVTAGALSSGCGVVLVFSGTGALPVTTRFANTADPFDAFSATRRVGNGSTQTTLTGATWYNLNAVSTGTVYSLGVAPTVVSEHVNGSLLASQAGPHSFGDTNSLTTVGGTNAIYFTGQLAEAILIPGFLFDDVRQKTEGYLAHKWGLTASLPSGHPYKVNPPAP
jgi:hypothetical protein